MKVMTPSKLINLIKLEYPRFNSFIPKLEKLAKNYPDVLVALSIGGGDCEADGIIAPITEDGEIDESQRRHISEGEPLPAEPFVFVPDR